MPKGVYQRKPHSEEWKRRHSALLMGHITTLETREKQRIGNIGKKRSKETRTKLSLVAKKRVGRLNHFFGKVHTTETKERIAASRRGICYSRPPIIKGADHWNWKGGITPVNIALRSSQRYYNWRNIVFERDNYTCKICGDSSGGNLNAHHIYPWATFEHLRFEVENGITLCKQCHNEYHANQRRTIAKVG